MDPELRDVDLGPWKAEDLGETASLFAGLGADDRLPADVRFLSNVAKLIRQRNAMDKTASDPALPAVFLLSPVPPANLKQSVTRIPMLSNGTTVLNGNIWLVHAAVNSGYLVEDSPKDGDDLFRFVTDSLGLGDVLAVIYEPRGPNPTIRFYPRGMNDPDTCNVLLAQGEKVTEDQIFHVIDRVYEQCLRTPDCQSHVGKLWEDSDKCWPVHDAEAVVQMNLRIGLVGHFLICTVRDEQKTVVGRTDLEIEQNDPLNPGNVIRHALLELKILRSFRHTGTPVPPRETLDWVALGMEQARQYGIDKDSRLATLCCFDMRSTDEKETCFDHVRDKARKAKVILRRWYLYGSSERYRKRHG
jgi:hypothetical protein